MPKATVTPITQRVREVKTRLQSSIIGKAVPQASTRTVKLVDELADIRTQIAELNTRKDEIGGRLVRRVMDEGEADHDGKVRLQTSTSNLVLIDTANRYVDAKLLLALGVKASIIEKCTKVTPYQYVSVTAKKEPAVELPGRKRRELR